MDRKNRKQTLNLDHGCSAITCIAAHPPTHLVATGEYGEKTSMDPDSKVSEWSVGSYFRPSMVSFWAR